MGIELGFCGVEMGTDEMASCLGLDFDEGVGALTYNVVSFVYCFANNVSSYAGLEGNELGFLTL